MRDLRDPGVLGRLILLEAKARKIPASQAYDTSEFVDLVVNWAGDGFMSSNPANHHSKVRQDLGDLTA